MSNTRATVGAVVAAFLERCGVRQAFGVISIHNMPILHAFDQRGEIRFVPARSESGAMNMADANARVSGGLGVAVTSTGTAAGNACGAMVEALTAGTPVLHLTGQIEVPYLDRELAYIHEARDQLSMLKAVSKAAFRVWSAESALGTLKEAVRTALTAPTGPVSVEIPIDIQGQQIDWPADLEPLPVAAPVPDAQALDRLAERLAQAKRPLLWLGGGARHAGDAVKRLLAMGFGVVTSVQGRGIVAEGHAQSLGAYNLYGPVEQFYGTCDAMVVVGSRLRSNETLKYKLKLPRPLYRIDADPRQDGRCYGSELFVGGDSALALAGLADRLEGRMKVDATFAKDLANARAAAEKIVRDGLGPYAALVDALQAAAGKDFVWVRDVTVSNSTWGNRALLIDGPRDGVHALGGGIGQGVQMAIGAALAAQSSASAEGAALAAQSSASAEGAALAAQSSASAKGAALAAQSPASARGAALAAGKRKTLCLVGDGGLQVNIGELATLVQEQADVVVVLMNDRGYGVIKNIQDAHYGGQRCYVDLHTPDFAQLAQSIALPFQRVRDLAQVKGPLVEALGRKGPTLIEIDMLAVGPFAAAFAGPPVKTKAEA